MKYTYIHSPMDKKLICNETKELVNVDYPTIVEIFLIPNIVKDRERESIERYEIMKEELYESKLH